MTTPAELVSQQRASWEAEVSAKLAGLLTRDDPKTADRNDAGASSGTTVRDCSTEDEREA